MPRSRTHASRRAARLASGAIQPDPERTPARIGHWYREVWKRIGYLQDRDRGATAWTSSRERNQAIRVAIGRWLAASLAEENTPGRGDW